LSGAATAQRDVQKQAFTTRTPLASFQRVGCQEDVKWRRRKKTEQKWRWSNLNICLRAPRSLLDRSQTTRKQRVDLDLITTAFHSGTVLTITYLLSQPPVVQSLALPGESHFAPLVRLPILALPQPRAHLLGFLLLHRHLHRHHFHLRLDLCCPDLCCPGPGPGHVPESLFLRRDGTRLAWLHVQIESQAAPAPSYSSHPQSRPPSRLPPRLPQSLRHRLPLPVVHGQPHRLLPPSPRPLIHPLPRPRPRPSRPSGLSPSTALVPSSPLLPTSSVTRPRPCSSLRKSTPSGIHALQSGVGVGLWVSGTLSDMKRGGTRISSLLCPSVPPLSGHGILSGAVPATSHPETRTHSRAPHTHAHGTSHSASPIPECFPVTSARGCRSVVAYI